MNTTVITNKPNGKLDTLPNEATNDISSDDSNPKQFKSFYLGINFGNSSTKLYSESITVPNRELILPSYFKEVDSLIENLQGSGDLVNRDATISFGFDNGKEKEHYIAGAGARAEGSIAVVDRASGKVDYFKHSVLACIAVVLTHNKDYQDTKAVTVYITGTVPDGGQINLAKEDVNGKHTVYLSSSSGERKVTVTIKVLKIFLETEPFGKLSVLQMKNDKKKGVIDFGFGNTTFAIFDPAGNLIAQKSVKANARFKVGVHSFIDDLSNSAETYKLFKRYLSFDFLSQVLETGLNSEEKLIIKNEDATELYSKTIDKWLKHNLDLFHEWADREGLGENVDLFAIGGGCKLPLVKKKLQDKGFNFTNYDSRFADAVALDKFAGAMYAKVSSKKTKSSK